MDVRLPDGRVVTNVPEGITQTELMARLNKAEAEDPGAMGAFAVGVGRTFDKGVQGVRQIYNSAIGDQSTLDAIAADEADKDARYKRLQDKRPIATTLGEIGGTAAAIPVTGGGALPAAALRFAAAGAIPGLVSYGTPSERLTAGGLGAVGGAIGAALPSAIGAGVSKLRGNTGASVLADVAQSDPATLAKALRAGATELAPGVPVSTPQAAMNPGLSQAWRTLETMPKVNPQLTDFAARQDVARKSALSRVAQPNGMTSIEAAENASATILDRAKANKSAAKAAASAKFGAVDPLKESGLQLPVDEIKASFNDIFGTPGSKPAAGDLPRLMQDISGLVEPKAVKVAKSKRGAVDPSVDTLGDAIRKWGGLNLKEGGGEVQWLRESDLGKRSPLGPFVRTQGGLTLEQAAERAQQTGYLQAFDQKELMARLMDEARGDLQFADPGLMRRAETEAAKAASEIQSPVSWETLQALRSRAGDIVAEANRTQTNLPEAKVAAQIKAALDETMARVAEGRPYREVDGFPENFTPEMRAKAQDALKSWRQYKQDFASGPASRVGRYGSDGKPMLDGAEAVKAFVNSKATQRPDAEQLLKVTPNPEDFPAREAARSYLMADLLEKAAPRDKPLSPAMLDRWMNQRAEGLPVLFPDYKMAVLKGVQADLNRADKASNLGRVAGSDTAQKLRGTSAFVPAANMLSNFVPTQIGKAAVRGIAGAAEEAAANRRAQQVLPLLLDPLEAAAALEKQALLVRLGLLSPEAATVGARLGAATAGGLLGN
jgi:hypothetical protein